jgi:hypothetical protein
MARSDVSLEIDDAEGFVSAIPSELKEFREIGAGLRWVIEALKKIRRESSCRLAPGGDPGFSRNHEEVHLRGHPCYRVPREGVSCERI